MPQRKKMTDAEAQKYLRKAHLSAKRFNFRHDVEDLAQATVLRMLEDPDSGRSSEQHFIDVIRQQLGRPGSEAQKARVALHGSISHGSKDDCVRVSGSHEPDPIASIDFHKLVDMLGRTDERAFILLRFQYGFNEKEIAHLFGVTESRISQRLAGVVERLRHIVLASERAAEEGPARDREDTHGETDPEAAAAHLSLELDSLFADGALPEGE